MLQRLRNALAPIEYPNGPAPRSCSIARRRLPPSISSCRKEILVSPSGRWIRHLATSASPSHRRLDNVVTPFWVAPMSRPSDCSSYSYCRGPLAVTNDALYRKVGSRCSIRTTPLSTAAAPGLRVLACRFSVHSPEKSGFCCAIAKHASPRRIPLTIHIRINISALLPRRSIRRYYRSIWPTITNSPFNEFYLSRIDLREPDFRSLTYIALQCIRDPGMELGKDLVAASATPLVLAILAEGDSYGYAIIKRVTELSGGHLQWTDGMLYPVLHRLERQGLVAAKWSASENGRRRKYYRITREGRAQLAAQRKQWQAVDGTLRGIWMKACTA